MEELQRISRKNGLLFLSTIMLLLIPLLSSPQFARCAEIGDGRVFAQLPDFPGFPEGIVINKGKIYVTTPARFGTAGTGASQIFVYQVNGMLMDIIDIQDEDLSQEHALSGITVDGKNRLYVISTQLGILRLKKTSHGYTQEIWASAIPDLNPYDPVPPLPNDMVFDGQGNLYITDSLQATIWRVPPTGGNPQIWFQSPELIAFNEFQMGPNGIRLSPDRDYIYFIYSGSLPGDSSPRPGQVYRLPLVDFPALSDLQSVYTYSIFEVPDGIAFDRKGRLFVVIAGANAISILNFDDPDGVNLPVVFEENRLTGPNGSSIPYVQPANIAFSNCCRTLFVVNHALFFPPPPNFFAILEVYVGVKGDPLERPRI